ncbi:hypothetical protein WR25_26456 [Diploscapter pachys]|uniref:Small ribosomal subunit protein uS15m n=1 Tax=Diploscapter pachys TaxID=2018661 RepID=A0A2A2KD07_9BILA|nr:hypothetical protein WR25_26456 [Diploscapter pachys]
MNSLNFRRCLHNSAVTFRGRFPYYNPHKPLTDPVKQDPEYFEKAARLLPMGEFYDNYIDQLGKLYYEKVSYERDAHLKIDDNLVADQVKFGLPDIDRSAPRFPYKNVDMLNNAPESVKRIFSVELGARKDLSTAWKQTLIESVSHHSLDKSSTEMRIAWLTAMIRHYSLLVSDISKWTTKKPTFLTHRIWLYVNHRRKLLRLLREQNNESFERVIKALKIAYHVQKQPEHVKTRKAWAEHQLRLRVEEEKEKRLTALHQSYLENRDKKVQKLDKRMEELNEETKKVQGRIKQIQTIEGVVDPKDKYEPSLITELTEYTIHRQLFYHPKPTMKHYD